MITLRSGNYNKQDYERLLSVMIMSRGKYQEMCNKDCYTCPVRESCSDLASVIDYLQNCIDILEVFPVD